MEITMVTLCWLPRHLKIPDLGKLGREGNWQYPPVFTVYYIVIKYQAATANASQTFGFPHWFTTTVSCLVCSMPWSFGGYLTDAQAATFLFVNCHSASVLVADNIIKCCNRCAGSRSHMLYTRITWWFRFGSSWVQLYPGDQYWFSLPNYWTWHVHGVVQPVYVLWCNNLIQNCVCFCVVVEMWWHPL